MNLLPPNAEPSSARPVGSHKDHHVFLILLGLYTLIIGPILRADRYYADDLKRALIGRAGWDSNGRPLTTFLMNVIQCYDHALVDISPLTQIGAVALLAWIGVLIARRYAIRSPWLAALVAFPIGAQPFYQENLSFKFDALSMSVAIFLALLPILFIGKERKSWWLGVLALFASLNLYQPAINAYLIFMLLDVLIAQLEHRTPRELMRQLGSRVLQVGAAMLAYKLTVGAHVSGWVKQKTGMVQGFQDLHLIKTNVIDFYRFIGFSFNIHWWEYFGPLLVLLALCPIVIGVRYAWGLRRRHAAPVTAALLASSFLLPVLALLCVIGPMILLLNPEIEPRVLIGVGALLSAALIAMQASFRQWRRSDKWTLALGSVFALGMCTFASAYGNALGEQKNFENQIAARLSDDLAVLKASHPVRYFLINGMAGYSPVTTHVSQEFPLVKELIPPYIAEDDPFYTPTFLKYYISDVADISTTVHDGHSPFEPEILTKLCSAPVSSVTHSYDLRLIDDVAVVSFRNSLSAKCGVTQPLIRDPGADASPSGTVQDIQ